MPWVPIYTSIAMHDIPKYTSIAMPWVPKYTSIAMPGYRDDGEEGAGKRLRKGDRRREQTVRLRHFRSALWGRHFRGRRFVALE